eukprot:1292315-Pleurochrysis_carterae.AAC.2
MARAASPSSAAMTCAGKGSGTWMPAPGHCLALPPLPPLPPLLPAASPRGAAAAAAFSATSTATGSAAWPLACAAPAEHTPGATLGTDA